MDELPKELYQYVGYYIMQVAKAVWNRLPFKGERLSKNGGKSLDFIGDSVIPYVKDLLEVKNMCLDNELIFDNVLTPRDIFVSEQTLYFSINIIPMFSLIEFNGQRNAVFYVEMTNHFGIQNSGGIKLCFEALEQDKPGISVCTTPFVCIASGPAVEVEEVEDKDHGIPDLSDMISDEEDEEEPELIEGNQEMEGCGAVSAMEVQQMMSTKKPVPNYFYKKHRNKKRSFLRFLRRIVCCCGCAVSKSL